MSSFPSARTPLPPFKPKRHTRRRINGHHGEPPHPLLLLLHITPRTPVHPPCLSNRSGHPSRLPHSRWRITLCPGLALLYCSTNHLNNRHIRPSHQSQYSHTSPTLRPDKRSPPLLPYPSLHRLPWPVYLVFIPPHKHPLSRATLHWRIGQRVWRSLLKGRERGYNDLQLYPLRLHILLNHSKRTPRACNSHQRKLSPLNRNPPNHTRCRYKCRCSLLHRLTHPRRTRSLERRRCPLNNQERSPRRLY